MTSREVPPREEIGSGRVRDPWMMSSRPPVALYVDRSTRRWIVRDPEGDFWQLGPADGWIGRQPFELSDDADLEIVPGHYRYMLDLPF